MANLQYQTVQLTGIAPAYSAADVAGDTVAPNERGFLVVKNGGASPITVTIATPGQTEFGLDQPDIAVTVAASAEKMIGPMRDRLAVETGSVQVSYSAVTSVTVAAIRA